MNRLLASRPEVVAAVDASLNGWKVIHPGESGLVTVTVPGTSLRLTVAEAAAPLLVHVADRVNREVRSLAANNSKGGQDDAGWAFRKARHADGFSNHASGSAIDLNWQLWPQSGSARSMTASETAAASKIAADLAEVIFWGGNWNKQRDEMHWEVRPGVTPQKVKAYCEKHNLTASDSPVSHPNAAPPAPPTPSPTAPEELESTPVTFSNVPMLAVADVQPGKSDPSVRLLQQALNQVGAKITVDGQFGPATQTAYKNWQASLGFTGADCDGAPGASSLATLGDRTGLFLLAPP
jgi:hypothetical protein